MMSVSKESKSVEQRTRADIAGQSSHVYSKGFGTPVEIRISAPC